MDQHQKRGQGPNLTNDHEARIEADTCIGARASMDEIKVCEGSEIEFKF